MSDTKASSPRASRRRRARRDAEAEATPGWAATIWALLANPVTFGGLLALAGALLLTTPLSQMPATPSASWWVTAFRAPAAIQAGATVLVLAAAAGLALGLRRWSMAAGRGGRRGVEWSTEQADVAGTGEPPSEGRKGISRWSPLVGLALMAGGVLVGAFSWFASHADVPVSRISLPIGSEIQSYPARQTGGAYKVMLPQRLTVTGIDLSDRSATVEFQEVGGQEPTVRRLVAGQPVVFEGFNFSLLGVEYDQQVPLAVLASQEEGTIEAAGARGQEVRFALDGPSYEILEITPNYVGVMGPAVRLEHPELGRFWVFQRADELSKQPSFEHGLSLKRLETSPVAVLGVAREPATQTGAAAGLLFVIGLGLFLLVSDRLVRVRREGDELSWGAWSVNDAGGLAAGGPELDREESR